MVGEGIAPLTATPEPDVTEEVAVLAGVVLGKAVGFEELLGEVGG